jgi:hypothetical protein
MWGTWQVNFNTGFDWVALGGLRTFAIDSNRVLYFDKVSSTIPTGTQKINTNYNFNQTWTRLLPNVLFKRISASKSTFFITEQ